ncbi:MAG: hypothetical protein KBD25_01275 [Rickettsiaceae bacterium]|nr:hypothetical protein [Rickettsiaceae bacterium]
MYDFEKLVKRIIDLDAYNLAFSDEKFVPHPELNKLGLHVYRSIKSRMKWEENELNDSVRLNGFIRSSIDNIDQLESKILPIVRQCGFNIDKVDFKRKTVNHRPGDVQYNPHVDTFHPAIKVWILLQDIEERHGPLHYLAGSNLPSKRKLDFLHTQSNLLLDSGSVKRNDPEYDSGSFRIPQNYVMEEFTKMTGKKFDVVVADVSGIHYRGTAKPGTVRDTLYATLPRVNTFYTDKIKNLDYISVQDYYEKH